MWSCHTRPDWLARRPCTRVKHRIYGHVLTHVCDSWMSGSGGGDGVVVIVTISSSTHTPASRWPLLTQEIMYYYYYYYYKFMHELTWRRRARARSFKRRLECMRLVRSTQLLQSGPDRLVCRANSSRVWLLHKNILDLRQLGPQRRGTGVVVRLGQQVLLDHGKQVPAHHGMHAQDPRLAE